MQEFTLTTPTGKLVNGSILPNPNSQKLIVYSHGFGTRRDDRGLLTDIAEALKEDYAGILFDYAEIHDNGNTTVPSFSEQAEKLETVIHHFRKQLQPTEVNIITHSMGGIVAALAEVYEINKIVLTAPPAATLYERFLDLFGNRPNTIISEQGESSLQRSDGTQTFLYPNFWVEMKAIVPQNLFSELAQKAKATW